MWISVVSLAFLAVSKVLSLFFVINISPSMPRGIYRIHEVPAKLAVGDIVLFDIPVNMRDLAKARGWTPENLKYYLMKYVAAVEGDEIEISKEGLFIRDVQAAEVKTVDSQGRPLAVTYKRYRLKPGEIFAASPYEKSFDSRYFGPVKISALIAVATPVLTSK